LKVSTTTERPPRDAKNVSEQHRRRRYWW